MTYQPTFRYWTIAYTYSSGLHYPVGTVIRQGAYADKAMAEMNARLNAEFSATVEEVWY